MVKDKYHDHVRMALETDGWTITHDPYKIPMGGRNAYIDLGAERLLIGAERGSEKIAVEVKTFGGLSDLHDFQQATGQFMLYLFSLQEEEPERILFLAVPSAFYNRFFQDFFFQRFAQTFHIHLIVFDEQKRQIITWIK